MGDGQCQGCGPDSGRYDDDDEPRCKCGGSTVGESCSECGSPLCPMCFEGGAGFCTTCPTPDYKPEGYEDAPELSEVIRQRDDALAKVAELEAEVEQYESMVEQYEVETKVWRFNVHKAAVALGLHAWNLGPVLKEIARLKELE